MKRSILFFFLALSFLLGACTPYEPPYNKAEKSIKFYSVTTDYMISKYIQSLDIALKLDDFLSAPAGQQDSLEYLYFPDLKIRARDHGTFLKNLSNKVIVSISGTDQPLHQSGVQWRVENRTAETEDRAIVAYIRCVAEDTYEIEASENLHIGTYQDNGALYMEKMDLQVQISRLDDRYAKRGYEREYQVSGSGAYYDFEKYNREYLRNPSFYPFQVKVQFDLLEELKAFRLSTTNYETWGGIGYYGGLMEMSVHAGTKYNASDLKVMAELSGTPEIPVLTLRCAEETYTMTIPIH